MRGLDLAVFRAINDWPELLAPTMRFFSVATDYGWFKLALLALVVAMVAAGARTRRAAIQSLVAFPIADGITNLLKTYLPMNRPFADMGPREMILRIGQFPLPGEVAPLGTASAHSANMAAVATVFVLRLGWFGSPWILVALLTGLSRVYNGVHYPSQVVLGWIVGVAVGFAVVRAWDAFVDARARAATPKEATG